MQSTESVAISSNLARDLEAEHVPQDPAALISIRPPSLRSSRVFCWAVIAHHARLASVAGPCHGKPSLVGSDRARPPAIWLVSSACARSESVSYRLGHIVSRQLA
jgi:hypothetical protein